MADQPNEPRSSEADAPEIWEEWKYRHELFNGQLGRYAAVTAIISTLHYFREGVIATLGMWSLAMPILGFLFGLLALYFLAREYARVFFLRKMLRVIPDLERKRFVDDHPWFRWLMYPALHKVLFPALLAILIAFSGLNFAYTLIEAREPTSTQPTSVEGSPDAVGSRVS